MHPANTHPPLLRADDAVLVVVDMQEPFLRNLFERERVLAQRLHAAGRGEGAGGAGPRDDAVCGADGGASSRRYKERLQRRPGAGQDDVLLLGRAVPAGDRQRGRRQVLLCGVGGAYLRQPDGARSAGGGISRCIWWRRRSRRARKRTPASGSRRCANRASFPPPSNPLCTRCWAARERPPSAKSSSLSSRGPGSGSSGRALDGFRAALLQ